MIGFSVSQYSQVVGFCHMAERIAAMLETKINPYAPLPLVQRQGSIGTFLVCSVPVIKRPVLFRQPVDNYVGVQNLELFYQ
jgi:hypothetical protein